MPLSGRGGRGGLGPGAPKPSGGEDGMSLLEKAMRAVSAQVGPRGGPGSTRSSVSGSPPRHPVPVTDPSPAPKPLPVPVTDPSPVADPSLVPKPSPALLAAMSQPDPSFLARQQMMEIQKAVAKAQAVAPPKKLGRGQRLLQNLDAARGPGLQKQGTVSNELISKPIQAFDGSSNDGSPRDSDPSTPRSTPSPKQLAVPSVTVGAGPSHAQQADPPTADQPTADQPTADNPFRNFPQKPSHCVTGNEFHMGANVLQLKCEVDGFYQYHVTTAPMIDSQMLVNKLLDQHTERLGRGKLFDGRLLTLPTLFPERNFKLVSHRMPDNSPVELHVKYLRRVTFSDPVAKTVLNILFRRIMRELRLVPVGRHNYDPTTPAEVPEYKLEVWPGYITSVSEMEGGLMLCADVSHRVLRKETVLDMMATVLRKNSADYRKEILRTLVGGIILTRYNNKTYKVDDVAFDMDPTHTFLQRRTERDITYIEYYREQYNIGLVDHAQPLLVSNTKSSNPQEEPGKLFLIPELCYLTGLDDSMRSDFRVMKELSRHMRVGPAMRVKTLETFVRTIKENQRASEKLAEWRMSLTDRTMEGKGRCFLPEDIVFADKKVSATYKAQWNTSQVLTPVKVAHWLLVYLRRDQQRARDFILSYQQVAKHCGIDICDPQLEVITNDQTTTWVDSVSKHVNPHLQMVVVIMPTKRDDRYNTLKSLLCRTCPMPSQFIVSRTLSQPAKMRSIVERVALQINVKLGGDIWKLQIPLKKLMVVGMDVYHQGAGGAGADGQKAGGGTVAAVVGSMNASLTKYYSLPVVQGQGEELVTKLNSAFRALLMEFYNANGALPDKIVVYRDGVGDSMLPAVREFEVSGLLSTFASFHEGYSPQVAYLVVQKRINTRIFSLKHDSRGRSHDNPNPGSVVDHTITRKALFDFFLVSQFVTQGTVTPTHYVVVYNSTKLNPDQLQKLTYKMTHLYYNWPGTIRVPAPCQYAHKLAYFVGQNLRGMPSEKLANRLYYL